MRNASSPLPWRSLSLFLTQLGVFAAAATVALLWIPRTSPAVGVVPYVYMLTPALAAVTTRLLRKEGFADAGLRLGRGWKWYGIAWALPLGMMVAIFAVAVAIGSARLDLSLARLAELSPVPNAESMTPPPGLSETGFVILLAVANVTFMLVPAMLLGLGEELGWRSWLLQRTLPLGLWPAIIVTGVIWWAWHLPLGIIQTTPLPPGLLYPLGLLGAVGFGAVLTWIRLASGSIFPVALAHIASNQAAAALVILIDIDPVVQLVGLAAAPAAVAAFLYMAGSLRVGGAE